MIGQGRGEIKPVRDDGDRYASSLAVRRRYGLAALPANAGKVMSSQAILRQHEIAWRFVYTFADLIQKVIETRSFYLTPVTTLVETAEQVGTSLTDRERGSPRDP